MNPRRILLQIMLVLLLIPSPVSGQARDRLDGWGPFKFTMSKAEAIEAVRPHAVVFPDPVIIYDVEIGSQQFWAGVDFTQDQNAIRQIRLAPGTWSATKAKGPRGENVLQVPCLNRVEPFRKMVAEKYGPPDGPFEDKKDTFYTRQYTFSFLDGNRIIVESTYSPPGVGVGKNEHFCAQQIRYISQRAAPKATF